MKQCKRLFSAVVAIVVAVSLSQAQAPGGGGSYVPAPPAPPASMPGSAQSQATAGAAQTGSGYTYAYAAPSPTEYPHISSTQCRYLVTAPTPVGVSPFKIVMRNSRKNKLISEGTPVEVSLQPLYHSFNFMTFSDFGLWAESNSIPHMPNAVNPEMPPTGPPAGVGARNTHIGTFQVFKKYAGGAESMHCSPSGHSQDTVGSIQERMIQLLQYQFPYSPQLRHFRPSARHGCAFLWYPDHQTIAYGASVKFVAKLKAFGKWHRVESESWRVYRPPPPPPRRPYYRRREPVEFSTVMESYETMNNQLKNMERSLETAGVPGI